MVDPRRPRSSSPRHRPRASPSGSLAPELEVTLDDGSTYQLTDLDGEPIRLDALRGKVVWINFWASWCPPCQQETPILRELSERYRDQGLEIIGISVQETSVDDVTAYAERYDLDYTIGFDASGHIFRDVPGLRPADPVLHRHRRGPRPDRQRPGRRGRRECAHRVAAAGAARQRRVPPHRTTDIDVEVGTASSSIA